MAKITPITEHFQHFLVDLKESFWGDLYDQTKQAWKQFWRRSRSECGICTVAGERTSAVRCRIATTATVTTNAILSLASGPCGCALRAPGGRTFCRRG